MAETSVAITAGTGTPIDAYNVGTGSALRQAVVIADPVTTANVLNVNSNGTLAVQGYQTAPTTFSAVSTVSTLTSTAVTGFNIATVTLRTFTGTTPSITFSLQASDDNTNWVTIQGINNSTGVVATSWTQASALAAGTAGPSIDYTIGAYTNVRINVTAISGTTPSAAFGLALQSMPYEASPGIASLPALATGSNVIGALTANQSVNVAQIAGATTATGSGTSTGALRVELPTNGTGIVGLNAGSNTIGAVTGATKTTGGATTFTLISAATTNATVVKASAGTIYGIQASNTGASVAFLKIYNTSTSPTVGTTVAAKTLIIPAGGGITVPVSPAGLGFGTGISIAITGLATTADTTAVALNQVVANLDYA